MEIFRKLIPAFSKTTLVHLQGWGEPLTHPHLLDMIRAAKNAGCMVGTNTNGNLLKNKNIEALVNDGLDIMGFSLAGVDDKSDSIRPGTQIKHVRECIEKINRAKAKCGSDTPKIHIAYMLLRSGLGDLDKLPAFLNGLGVHQVVISSLSLVTDQDLEHESLLASDEKEYAELKKRLLDVRQASGEQGIEIHFHLVSPFLTPSDCSENIRRAIVVGSSGDISPCVMTRIPVTGENYYYFKGRKQSLKLLSFGNINDDSINTIWSRKEYKQFINSFETSRISNICSNCYKRCIDTLT